MLLTNSAISVQKLLLKWKPSRCDRKCLIRSAGLPLRMIGHPVDIRVSRGCQGVKVKSVSHLGAPAGSKRGFPQVHLHVAVRKRKGCRAIVISVGIIDPGCLVWVK